MPSCSHCGVEFNRPDNLQRHMKNKHQSPDTNETIMQIPPSTSLTFQHPFSMMVTGPSQSWKTEWTRKLLLLPLIQPPPERILWCFGQWQPLYEELQKRIPCIEFVHGIPDYLHCSQFMSPDKRNLIILDDLMTEAKGDQRIADLFTKGSHHRNISIVYLTQNVFPQGKVCRDIALNTQYLVLFNNPIYRLQVTTLAKRIYPSTSAIFMKRFEEATSRPYGYLVVDLKSSTSEQDRLRTDIFESSDQQGFEPPDDDNMSDVDDASSIGSIDDTHDPGPLGKRRKLRDERSRPDIWNRRFKDPLRHANIEHFKANVKGYEEQGYPFDQAVHLTANDNLPILRKRLRQEYTQFLIDFHHLQEDPIQQQILDSASTFRNQHDMSRTDSIRQAVKLRKDLFISKWPNHSSEEDTPVKETKGPEEE